MIQLRYRDAETPRSILISSLAFVPKGFFCSLTCVTVCARPGNINEGKGSRAGCWLHVGIYLCQWRGEERITMEEGLRCSSGAPSRPSSPKSPYRRVSRRTSTASRDTISHHFHGGFSVIKRLYRVEGLDSYLRWNMEPPTSDAQDYRFGNTVRSDWGNSASLSYSLRARITPRYTWSQWTDLVTA